MRYRVRNRRADRRYFGRSSSWTRALNIRPFFKRGGIRL